MIHIHMRDVRLRNNAGLEIAVCKADDALLDVSGEDRITTDKSEVTCSYCVTQWNARYPWAGEIR